MTKTIIRTMIHSMGIGLISSFIVLALDTIVGNEFNTIFTFHHLAILGIFGIGSTFAGYPLGLRRWGNDEAHRELKTSKELEHSLLEKNELILREVHHRIKNNMAIIISLLSLQTSTLKDQTAVNALNDACGRVRSMMLLYDKLYRKSNDYDVLSIKEYLETVMQDFSLSFNIGGELDVLQDIDDIFLDVKTIQTLGIIINELLTNIVKYAYNNGEHKIVAISVKKVNDTTIINLHDNGKGMPENIDFENTSGFGLMLVRSLVEQLKGTISIDRSHGTRITLTF